MSPVSFMEVANMAATLTRRRGRNRRPDVIQKPRGIIHPRVQKVGPEHFGIVAVDCAKARSKWMLSDFYGNVLVEPTVVEHNRQSFDAALAALRQAREGRQIHDLLVAVERTGRYHHPPARAFAAGGFEVRTVHPFTTKQFRQPADPGIKTDDKDLAAIARAAINGFALTEPVLDESWRQLQLLTRHRRDLVRKASILCCQIKEHLDAALPGYAACFPTLWEHPAAMTLALQVGGADELRLASRARLGGILDAAHVGFQQRTIDRVMEWVKKAAAPDIAAAHHRRIAADLEADRQRKEQEILALEREIAHLLCATPYVLLMSIPGVNVVSAAEYAAEMGPICNYANARCITGRAGLYPARYQSDQVDLSGPLIKCANRRLRFALMLIADNLISCNHYFATLAAKWRERKDDPRLIRVRVAQRFSRISFQMVAGQRVFDHPAARQRDYILQKLIAFHHQHQTSALQVQLDLQHASAHLPPGEHAAEAKPLQEELSRIQNNHRRGPQPLGEILPLVLATLGVSVLQSPPSGATGPT
jgi:transposase